MKKFSCACGAPLFFENHFCGACGRPTLYLPEARALLAADGAGGTFEPLGSVPAEGAGLWRRCRHEEHGCNWAVPAPAPGSAGDAALCASCELTRTVPDPGHAESVTRWRVFESAKRRLLFTLAALQRTPVPKGRDARRGLAFDFLVATGSAQVTTGHRDGVVTIDLAEADPVARTRIREQLGERYRTPLGHLRHEVGHYLWQLLIQDSERLDAFRGLFGDERVDYAEALERHYAAPPPEGWSESHVSAYATAHPFEDWAETCAHYLHAVDAVETAGEFGLAPVRPESFDRTLELWMELSVGLNAMSRSLGLEDAYPFVLTAPVRAKLTWVHEALAGEEKLG